MVACACQYNIYQVLHSVHLSDGVMLADNHTQEPLNLVTSGWSQDEDEVVQRSPDQRFQRYAEEIEYSIHRRTYRAYDAQTGREVSWNVIPVARLQAGLRKRIVGLLRLATRLQHPHLTSCIHFWLDQKKSEIVFISQMVINGCLKLHLNKTLRPKLKILKGWARQILCAVAYLHNLSEPVGLPLALSPTTIYINSNQNTLKLSLDCLLIPIINPLSAEILPPELTETGYSPSCDIYSFGYLLIHMATNKSPYSQVKNPYQKLRMMWESVMPNEFDEIGHTQLKQVIENCLTKGFKSIQQLSQNDFWSSSNDPADKLPVSMTESSNGQNQNTSTNGSVSPHHPYKKRLSINKSPTNVRQVKRISETVERVQKDSEFQFNMQFEEQKYEIRIPRPSVYDHPEIYDKFVQMITHKFEEQDNRTTFQNETNFFKISKTYKYQYRQSQMEQTDFTCFNTEPIGAAKMAFINLYENYRTVIEPLMVQPQTAFEEVVDQRMLMERRELEKMQKMERQKLHMKCKPSRQPDLDILNLEDGHLQGYNETEDFWQRMQMSRNTMDGELLNINFSSIMHIREDTGIPWLSGLQPKPCQDEKYEEKDIEANFIKYLTQREDDLEDEPRRSQGKLEIVLEEVPPNELDKSFTMGGKIQNDH